MTETEEKPPLVDLIPAIVQREKAVLPAGFDKWGIKSVRPDLKSYGGYQWPFPGSVAVASNPRPANTGACPKGEGDGLCVALSWRGMASGGIPARTMLLVAFKSGGVLGEDSVAGKLRCGEVAVVAVVDGERLLREAVGGADLGGANLRYANLGYANLGGANLGYANLRYADLGGADLGGADLGGATSNQRTLWPAEFNAASAGVRT